MEINYEEVYISAKHSTNCLAVGRWEGFSTKHALTKPINGSKLGSNSGGIQISGKIGDENAIISYNKIPNDQTDKKIVSCHNLT